MEQISTIFIRKMLNRLKCTSQRWEYMGHVSSVVANIRPEFRWTHSFGHLAELYITFDF